MSDISTTNTPRRTRETRPNIELPDGEILEPRLNFADELGICDKSAQRMNLPTTYVGGVAYVARNASLKIVAERIQRRNQPTRRRRRA
jgi:hypothetical protein